MKRQIYEDALKAETWLFLVILFQLAYQTEYNLKIFFSIVMTVNKIKSSFPVLRGRTVGSMGRSSAAKVQWKQVTGKSGRHLSEEERVYVNKLWWVCEVHTHALQSAYVFLNIWMYFFFNYPASEYNLRAGICYMQPKPSFQFIRKKIM